MHMAKTLKFFCFEIQIGKNVTSGSKCTQQYYKYQHLGVRKCRILIEWTELNIVTHHSNSNVITYQSIPDHPPKLKKMFAQ